MERKHYLPPVVYYHKRELANPDEEGVKTTHERKTLTWPTLKREEAWGSLSPELAPAIK